MSLAAVALGTGERRDLVAIAELVRRSARRPVIFVVDAAQALGSLRLPLAEVDAVVGCGRKWLLGPPTVGLLAVRPGLVEEAGWVVPCAGAGSQDPAGAWLPGAQRFEGGALPAPAIEGLGASNALLSAFPLELVEERILGLAEAVREGAVEQGLAVLSPGGRAASGVVHLGLPTANGAEAAARLQSRLAAHGVRVRVQAKLASGLRLRVSAHMWNRTEDVEQLFRVLRALGLGRTR